MEVVIVVGGGDDVSGSCGGRSCNCSGEERIRWKEAVVE
jgi:hypothetical protein